MPLPKVLILNQPFVTNTGGGITMSNLFQGWDNDKLAVACLGHILTKEIDPEICNNYYQLGYEEKKWVFPFSLLSRKYQSGLIEFNQLSKDKVVPEDTKSKSRVGLLNNYINPFLNYIGISHVISKIVLSDNFKKWLDDYKPDVVYAQCSSRESILFCISVQKYLNKPYIFHMMDDWISLIGNKGFMKNYWKKKIDSEFRTLLDVTDIHLGICDYMSVAYKEKYGKDFKTFHNPINLKFWQKGQKKNYELYERPTILYAGRIGLGIDSSLKYIADAIAMVNKDLGITIEFQIQSQKPPIWIYNYKNVVHKPFVSYNKLPIEFGSADFLVLPYDFSPKSLAYIKYSMPTKASEYMASGTPILIYAPEETALAQYAKKRSWACVVTEQSKTVIADNLKRLILNKAYRKNLSETAKKVAAHRHDDNIVTQRFQKIIIETSNL